MPRGHRTGQKERGQESRQGAGFCRRGVDLGYKTAPGGWNNRQHPHQNTDQVHRRERKRQRDRETSNR